LWVFARIAEERCITKKVVLSAMPADFPSVK